MKKLFTLMKIVPILMLMAICGLQAQAPIVIGTGTTTVSNLPFQTRDRNNRTQMLYTAAEITAAGGSAGKIIKMGFNLTAKHSGVNTSGAVSLMNLSIKLHQTSLTALSAWVPGTTQCYSNPTFVFPNIGWYDFDLTTPFDWDGTSNLIVEICVAMTNDYSASGDVNVITYTSNTGKVYTQSEDGDAGRGCALTGGAASSSRPNIRFTIQSGVASLTPAEGQILQLGNLYDNAATFPQIFPGISLNTVPATPVRKVRYKIAGPGNPGEFGYKVIYSGYAPNTTDTMWTLTTAMNNATHRYSAAIGLAAAANGGLDLSTNQAQLTPGTYTASAATYVGTETTPQMTKENKFSIALERDIAISEVLHPIKNDKYSIILGATASIMKVKNLGTVPVTAFDVVAKYYRFNTQNVPVFVKSDTIYWRSGETGQILNHNQSATVEFPNFMFPMFGTYKVEYSVKYVDLVTPSNTDMDLSSNVYPRVGAPDHIFYVANSVELQVQGIILPKKTGKYYLGVPFKPVAHYANIGMSDTINVRAYMKITKIDQFGFPSSTPAYKDSTIVTEIGSGDYGIGTFPTFTPNLEGYYIVETNIFPNDPTPHNNIMRDTFFVVGQMSGVYTVGNRFATDLQRNYLTLKDVENDLFLRGISSDVTFQLTDSLYQIGDPTATDINASAKPAIDFSSMIIGTKKNNAFRKVRFEPYADKALTRNSITIEIKSGIGFYIAQSTIPTNQNASVYKVSATEKRLFANPYGKFEFDGGVNKSIRFSMNTASNLRIPVYFGTGVSNSMIKNCIFTDNSPTPSVAAALPVVNFIEGSYTYEPDAKANNNPNYAYSSAIVMRSVMPEDKIAITNIYNLDSLSNDNNVISDNDISGFSYGIVSLGTGVLFDYMRGNLKNLYSTSNQYIHNRIHNVKRAGIVIGYERNSVVKNNSIFNIDGSSLIPNSAGIILGGEGRPTTRAYNTTGLTISSNEIYNINGVAAVYGIKAEQFFNDYLTFGSYPNDNENLKVLNNMIWGLTTSQATASKFGISVASSRKDDPALSDYNRLISPYTKRYKMNNTAIINNTIVIPDEVPSVANSGVIAGITVLNAKNSLIKNNAVAIKDTEISPDCKIASCMLLQGELPKEPNYISNRNAYEVSPVISIYRLIEMNAKDTIIEEGDRLDYHTIFQWQSWTNQDTNSVVGNFTNDMVYANTNGDITYRIKSSPDVPLGSMLNDNGDYLPGYLTHDIDGKIKGSAGVRYDIGACEFEGRYYGEDIAVLNVSEPNRYKTGSGLFADAEYIMQLPPYNSQAIIKNYGLTSLTNIPVQLVISIETENGVFVPIDTLLQSTSLVPGEYKTVSYSLPSNSGIKFPSTYQQLIDSGKNYTIPNHFKAMKEQVTPRYKFTAVSLTNDMRISNNKFEKYVRYYVPQSKLSMLVSGENMATELNGVTDKDIIAGRLNGDSLKKNLTKLGYYESVDSVANYDVFDRNGWERRNIDYTIYRNLYWADGNEKALNRYQVSNFSKFLTSQFDGLKRNLVIGSQEMVRMLMDNNSLEYDSLFVVNQLKTNVGNPVTPKILGSVWQAYTDTVIGMGIALQTREKIMATANLNDAPPYPGVLKNEFTVGSVLPAYIYRNSPDTNDATAGIVYAGNNTNLVYLAIDWRHWKSGTKVLKGIYDFIYRNGGLYVPVELTEFAALKLSNRVELSWATTYEFNSDRFEVERAAKSFAGNSEFIKIAEVAANNIVVSTKEYGPVVDYNVNSGTTYLYRLKMIDRDGSFTYSPEVKVSYDYSVLEFTKVTPNPVSNNAIVTYVVPQQSNLEITMYDANGVAVKSLFSGISPAGAMSINFDSAGLPSGAYTLIMSDGTTVATQQIRIQK